MTRRGILRFTAAIGAALVAWVFPPFHVLRLDQARGSKAKEAANFNATGFAEKFWDENLKQSLTRAAGATAILDAIDGDFQAAREKYGRTVGISNAYYVFIQGNGRIVSVDSKGVGLAIRDGSVGPDVVLPTGMIFGNTARDATGLLDLDAFTNSQHFNDLSIELNRLVETRVLPGLRGQAKVGKRVRFVGCAEVARDPKRRKPLKVVPLSVDIIEPGQPE